MRLWHQKLISKLPQKQLSGQWRECIALLGNGWGKNHSVVNYVFEHNEACLIAFTGLVYDEMLKREYKPNYDLIKKAMLKRHCESEWLMLLNEATNIFCENYIIYPEHNEEYYKECIENLKKKGINIE